ncbi:hypothetical protein Pmani_033681 [Petrolisthes manimaculis]|uniref:Uncharacterized protein n=1 Tax=Petrolisthes manimaculis TaxID=1843537 RepID=A0AAE1NRF0_9EUCA|nr:hypothetical protein Pmani_033681 [Petrolisthes manimaculis]
MLAPGVSVWRLKETTGRKKGSPSRDKLILEPTVEGPKEWVAFLGLGALSAAVMSSADSSLHQKEGKMTGH